jgi:hypothetical protein
MVYTPERQICLSIFLPVTLMICVSLPGAGSPRIEETYKGSSRFLGSGYQLTEQESVFSEVDFWTGFVDSVATVLSPKFLSPTRVIFCDLRDQRVIIADGDEESIKSGAIPRQAHSCGIRAVWRPRSDLRLSTFPDVKAMQLLQQYLMV